VFDKLKILVSRKRKGVLCPNCGIYHTDFSISFGEPQFIVGFSDEECATRVKKNTDLCVVDKEHYFIRAILELPIIARNEVFSLGVWVSQSRENFNRYVETFESDQAGNHSFGWVSVPFRMFSLEGETSPANLEAKIHWGGKSERPKVTLWEELEHPFAQAQRDGITLEQANELMHLADGSK